MLHISCTLALGSCAHSAVSGAYSACVWTEGLHLSGEQLSASTREQVLSPPGVKSHLKSGIVHTHVDQEGVCGREAAVLHHLSMK